MEINRDMQMKENSRLVSVIIPVYNAEKYLEKCLESIAKQSYENLQIILVDDGSTDASSQICDTFAERDKRVVVYHNENHGPGYSRNYGIDRSEGDFITFVDSDDWVDEDYVLNLVRVMMETKSDIAISPWYCESLNYTEISRTDPNQLTGKLSEDFIKLHGFMSGPCQKLYRRDLILEKNLRFEANRVYAEDRVFNCDYLRNVKKYVYVDSPQYHYRLYNESSLTHQMTEKAFDDALYGLKKEKEFMTDINASCKYERLCDAVIWIVYRFWQTKESGDDYHAFCERFWKAKTIVPMGWSCTSIKKMIAGIAYACNLPWVFYLWGKWKYRRMESRIIRDVKMHNEKVE